MPAAPQQRIYRPDGETLRALLLSTSSLICVQGPVRSGKSVAMCMRLMRAIMEQPKDAKGRRRSRWLVIRQSYPDLLASTIKTWLEWFPEATYGRFYNTPPYRHEIRLPDGVEATVEFESFDGEADIPSLKSREYTGAWINEAQFYSRKFVVAVYERTGWFPVPGGPKFLQLDMNAPPLGHWVPMMRGDAPIPEELTEAERRALKKPDNWEFLTQPAWFVEEKDQSGRVLEYKINPAAENINIVGERSVYELLEGRTQDEIDADLMNRVLILQPGRAVFPMFTRDTHIAKTPLKPVEGVPLKVGVDFGRQPAAVVMQHVQGRWMVLREILGTNIAADEFAPLVAKRLAQHYPGWGGDGQPEIEFWGDPSGDSARGETDSTTAFQIWAKHGMTVRKADKAGRRAIRIETMTSVLNRMVGGQPAILYCPVNCPTLTTAMAGGYCYRRKRVSGSPTYEDEPDKKGPFSHPVDASIEPLMGTGEGRAVLGRENKPRAVQTLKPTNPFYRGQASRGRLSVFNR
jgi:hypothetical protein